MTPIGRVRGGDWDELLNLDDENDENDQEKEMQGEKSKTRVEACRKKGENVLSTLFKLGSRIGELCESFWQLNWHATRFPGNRQVALANKKTSGPKRYLLSSSVGCRVNDAEEKKKMIQKQDVN